MSRCRSCGAEIIWIRTKKGRNMPCDPEPVHYRKQVHGQEGMITLVTPDGDVIVGQKSYDDSDQTGYISHFATCPDANKFRGRNA